MNQKIKKLLVSGLLLIGSRVNAQNTTNIISLCPSDMIHIQGLMLQGNILQLQDTTCEEWMPGSIRRCSRFNREEWLSIITTLDTEPLDFCIDRYEYPNKLGVNPTIHISWDEASSICESLDKRLCTEDEWTFACEGEEGLPYPYGYERSNETCNIDRPWIDYHDHTLEELWQGSPSGSYPECISPFGVYDMTGNIDEWTTSTSSEGYPSIMKGGYWGPVRARCRPSTRAHGPSFVFYQQGFRCCSNIVSQ